MIGDWNDPRPDLHRGQSYDCFICGHRVWAHRAWRVENSAAFSLYAHQHCIGDKSAREIEVFFLSAIQDIALGRRITPEPITA